jgi:mannosyltransferase
MEAASLRPSGRTAVTQSLADAVRARSRVFWIVAGVTTVAALLRFVTLGMQSYHHDEIVTATRVLGGSFGKAMDVVGYSESAPPLYYALAWIWTQVTGTGEFGLRAISALAGVATVPVAYLIGRELRGNRAGVLGAALVAVNPMLLWYSQEARAYSLLALLCALSLLYCVRALRGGERRDVILWGLFSALALATHYFALFPLVAEFFLLLRRRRRPVLPGIGIIALGALALAPLAIHQMSYNHAEWIGRFTLGHRLWETAATFLTGETGDIIGGPERPALAFLPLALSLAAFALLALRASREERRAASVPLLVGLTAIGIPLLLALVSASKDYVLARNLLPALVPLLVVVAIALTAERARRLGTAVAAALLAYSLGFCVWVDFSPELQRPDWGAVAAHLGKPEAPRATVTWVLGEAPLRYYLRTGGIQVKPSEHYDWLVRELAFVSDGEVPPLPPKLVGPRFHETASEDTGRLFIRRYRVAGPGLAPLRLRAVGHAGLDFRTVGVLLDGVGPS